MITRVRPVLIEWSGATGFTDPIVVEPSGSPLDAPWLDRLLRTYRERGWRYRIVRNPYPPPYARGRPSSPAPLTGSEP